MNNYLENGIIIRVRVPQLCVINKILRILTKNAENSTEIVWPVIYRVRLKIQKIISVQISLHRPTDVILVGHIGLLRITH